MAKPLGATLRSARLAERLSLRDLSALTNMSSGQLSQIENGLREPKFATVVRIALALGKSLDELARDAGYLGLASDRSPALPHSARERLALIGRFKGLETDVARVTEDIRLLNHHYNEILESVRVAKKRPLKKNPSRN